MSEVDAARCRVRVTLPDRGDTQSSWLDVLQPHASQTRAIYRLPLVGELVACLLDEHDEDGCVVGALYHANNRPPTDDAAVCLVRFGDGTQISYDESQHRLSVTLADGAEVVVAGGASEVALADLVTDALTALKDAIGNGVPAPMDGGAALKASIVAALAAWPPAIASDVLKSD